MSDYKRLTDDELYDFLSRVFVQLQPTLTQQMMSCAKELLEYRSKIANGELAEAKHGKWIECPRYRTKICSVCKRMQVERLSGYYCPFCGAKMDLEEQQ